MSSIPYETATAGDRALAELQKCLAKFGCQQFGTMVDREHGETAVCGNETRRTSRYGTGEGGLVMAYG